MDNSFNIKSEFYRYDGEQDLLEIRKNIIRESLSDVYDRSSNFETIATLNGVDYVNDSNAFTPDKTGSSLLRCFKPVTWILAQPADINELSGISEIVEEKVNSIICLGENVNKVVNAFGTGKAELFLNAETMEEAVKIAAVITKPGEMVLFSPASDSVEKNAGKNFNKAVKGLKKK